MVSLRPIISSLLLVAAFISAASAAEGDLEREFRSAQRSILTQLRSKNSEARLGAVKKLEAFPIVEAAKVLLQNGMASGDAAVRRASYEALLKCKNDKKIGHFLAGEISWDLKRGAGDEGTCGALGVLLVSEDPDLQDQADRLLSQAAGNPAGALLLAALADELGAEGSETSLAALGKLVNLPQFSEHFALRRAVTQALIRIRRPEAVTALVEILASAQGEVRRDIVLHLSAISGKKVGLDPNDWNAWWKASRATFTFPKRDPSVKQVAPTEPAPQGSATYYGLPLLADRIIFVMDTSGSMGGGRITAAKRELIDAIAGLPESTHFSVLVFNSRFAVWQAQLVPATSENKEAACRFVASQSVAGQTASYDALEAALSFDAEAVYFLTDGAPTQGKVTQPASIVATVTKLNRSRRMTINSIGIGVEAKGSVFDGFLETLAAQNYGEYIRVDQ